MTFGPLFDHFDPSDREKWGSDQPKSDQNVLLTAALLLYHPPHTPWGYWLRQSGSSLLPSGSPPILDDLAVRPPQFPLSLPVPPCGRERELRGVPSGAHKKYQRTTSDTIWFLFVSLAFFVGFFVFLFLVFVSGLLCFLAWFFL